MTVALLLGAAAHAAGTGAPQLVDVTKEAGITFTHVNGGLGQKHLFEIMGGGAAFLDMDGDGDLDLFFVQSGPLPGKTHFGKGRAAFPNALYENLGNGKFKDVTKGSGIEGKGYGQGVAVGDVDGDGLPDVYVTCFGADELYRNLGKGKFKDVTRESGIGNTLWGSSAAFADLDADGDLDLYVANYAAFDPNKAPYCGNHVEGVRSYCTPEGFKPLPHVLYLNRGDGTFEDVTKFAGVDLRDGRGLGVVAGDYDDDGLLDLYVANDLNRNFLLHNVSRFAGKTRALHFEDVTTQSGTGYSPTGKTEAGMGVDFGDVDGDGRLDIFVTNFAEETNELYWNAGDGTFPITTERMGLGKVSWPFVGFGTGLVDLDNDGDLDIFVANGHVLDDVDLYRKDVTFHQRKLLFVNKGDGTFVESAASSSPALLRPEVSRAAAFGDYDNDGDIDIAVANNDGPAVLLRNDGPAGKSVTLVLHGKGKNTQGLGARITAVVGGATLVREARTAFSYCAANDPRVLIGLGDAPAASRITVRWLSGKTTELKDVGPGPRVVEEP
ncbi:MAG: CRTAC1 family protein [Acidobacteriota bacterium]